MSDPGVNPSEPAASWLDEARVPVARPDVLIVGAGITGLWLRARLARIGYSSITVEAADIADGQTIGSQGIIHGGVKYALTGKASRAAGAIAPMPARWQGCLAGRGELQLETARVLSDFHDLWTTGSLASRLAGAVASRAVRTPGRAIERRDWQSAYAHADDGISIYRVDEQVVDPASLAHALVGCVDDPIIAIDGPDAFLFDPPIVGREGRFRLRRRIVPGVDPAGWAGRGPELSVSPTMTVLTAGGGNEAILDRIAASARTTDPERRFDRILMQRRPLHQVFVRSPGLPELFAHCVGPSTTPRVTVTSQPDSTGRMVWNVGGGIAEKGIERDPEAQMRAARDELCACLPWLASEVERAEFATLWWERAEGLTKGGRRPDEPVVTPISWEGLKPGIEATRVVAAWPTKLAFAPLVADIVEDLMGGVPARQPKVSSDLHAPPPVAALPWEREELAWSRI